MIKRYMIDTLWRKLPKSLSILTIAVALSNIAVAETNFGQVSNYVANMLQNNHYSKQDFNDEVSEKLLENFLTFLDFNRLYFTKADVDTFRKKYATTLDDKIFNEDISPATEIYDLYYKRVKDRVAEIKRVVEEDGFEFDSNRTVELSRKESDWPVDEADADRIWSNIIEGELLQEKLRANALEQKAKEKNEEKPKADKETPQERITSRYERFLKSLDENNSEDVTNYFLSSLATAYDPHSEYFSQSELDNFQISMKNALIGIGALLVMEDGSAKIQGLVVGGPADKGGELKVNDRIVAVGEGLEGEMVDIMYMKIQKVVELIRGKEGSVVRLKVIPAAASDPSETVEIIINREQVNLKDKLANAEMIEMKNKEGKEERIGWIYLSSFYADMEGGTRSTTADVRRLLDRLMKENISGLVLDLRGNGGGSLEEAVNLTGLFIPRGPVVQSKDARDSIDSLSSRNRFPVYEGPMVVMTDRVSASASEILAAALQDYDRAVIVGEKSTFGKGTVQTIMPVARYMPFFSDKERAGALKVTIQKFYRIAGGATQLKGVVPDIILRSRRDALEIGEEALKNPLAYSTIKAKDYSLFKGMEVDLDQLKGASDQRIEGNREFAYIEEDTQRLKEQIEENEVSLNLEKRMGEAEENKARRKARRESRTEFFAEVEEQEKGLFNVYKLTLDNVDQQDLVSQEEFSKEDETGMRMALENEDEESEPEYPHGFDPAKREALNIVGDIIVQLEAKSHLSKTAPVSK